MRFRHSIAFGTLVTLILLFTISGAGIGQDAGPKSQPLPKPYETPSTKLYAKVLGWPDDKKPTAPEGFEVTLFAKGLDNPRWSYVMPNGDVLVVESKTVPRKQVSDDQKKSQNTKGTGSANRITIFRDKDKDGVADEANVFLSELNQPFGMLWLNDYFYVANTNEVLRFPCKKDQTKIESKGESILELPADGYNNHWTRNLIASPDGKKIYVSVGSATNVDEEGIDAKDQRRATILECDPDGKNMRVFGSGLRNPVGMAWEPKTKALWTAVNERDELGDELVPDYITSVQDGGFYGWPYSYFGANEDPRHKGKRPDLVKKAIVPDLAVGSHTASLGLAFYQGKAFPEKYRGGVFIGQRGSWNSSKLVGYRVAFVPFKDGKPSGPPEDFLTGFIKNETEVYGRPVGVTELPDGSLLVCDDAANRVWRVAAKRK